VLIAGDEFGPVAGFPGRDDRLRAGLTGAVAVSVGAEPDGVPAGVLHLGGGPRRFRALLADQVRHHRRASPPGPPAVPAARPWGQRTGYVPRSSPRPTRPGG
jgi:hypothetical protein